MTGGLSFINGRGFSRFLRIPAGVAFLPPSSSRQLFLVPASASPRLLLSSPQTPPLFILFAVTLEG